MQFDVQKYEITDLDRRIKVVCVYKLHMDHKKYIGLLWEITEAWAQMLQKTRNQTALAQ